MGAFHTCGHVNRLGPSSFPLPPSISFAPLAANFMFATIAPQRFVVATTTTMGYNNNNNNGLEYSKIYLRYYLEQSQGLERV